MAGNDWGMNDARADAQGNDWGADDAPAARRELPEGVRPSEAGAGRGSAMDPRQLGVPDAAERVPQKIVPGAPPPLDFKPVPSNGGFDPTFVVNREPYGSVLEDQGGGDVSNVVASRRAGAQEDLTPRPRIEPRTRTADTTMADKGGMLRDAPMPVRAAAQAAAGAAEGAWGTVRAGADIADSLGVPGAAAAARFAGSAAQGAKQYQEGMGDPLPSTDFGPDSPVPYLRKQAEGAASSLGTSAAFAVGLGAKAVIPLMSIQSAGQQYQAAREAGLEPGAALANAIPYGTFEAIGEKFQGLDKAAAALRTLMTRGVSAREVKTAGDILMHAGIREVPGEVLTYLGQTGVDLLPGIGLNPNLTVEQFIDGLRDTVVQSSMMGLATGGGGAIAAARARTPRERSAEDIARAKGFLVRQEQIDRMGKAGEKELAGQMQRQLDGERAEGEIALMADKPWGRSPEFAQRYRELRAGGVKPAEAAARASMHASWGELAGGVGLDEDAWRKAADAAAKLPLDKVPGFFEAFTAQMVKRGRAQTLPEGTIAGAVAGVRDDATHTALADVYGEQAPTATMTAIQELERRADGAAPAASGSETAVPEPQAALPATNEPQGETAADFGADDLTRNAHGMHAGASSPNNDKSATREQILAGNAPLGHMRIGGMGASIENAPGSERIDLHNEPPNWRTPMAHGYGYGYFKRTEAADSTQAKRQGIDAFIREDIPENYDGPVHVIDQVGKGGRFDEHKAIVAPISDAQARQVYLAHYEPGWQGLGAMRTFDTFSEFKKWAQDGRKSDPANPDAFVRNPFGEHWSLKPAAQADARAAGDGQAARPDAAAGSPGALAGAQPVAVTPLRVGITPNDAQPVSIRAGVIHVGEEPAYDYDSGEPVRIEGGASDAQLKQALRQAGALGRRQRFFGGARQEQPAQHDEPAPDALVKADDGQPFKSKAQAQKARKGHPDKRVVRIEGGWALADKTAAQLEAEAAAARRLTGNTGEAGSPISAHAFIAAAGGLQRSAMADAGFDRNLQVGSRWLFAGQGKGLTIEQATERLVEAGYLPEGAGHNQAFDLLRKSATQTPQYTPEGWERIAQAEGQARFDEHLQALAEQEAQGADPFAPLDQDLLDEVGFDDLDPEEQRDFAALVAAAEAEGIDTEAILEEAAKLTQNGDLHAYHAEVTRLLALQRAARAGDGRGQPAAAPGGGQGRPGAVQPGEQGRQPVPGQAGDEAAAGQAGDQQGAVERARITRDTPAPQGTTIVDGQGRQYRVHVNRGHGTLVTHPIVDGKPQVSADTAVRFWVGGDDMQPAGENDRTDPVYRADRELITPSQDESIGKNDAGEPLYRRKDGSVYRMHAGKPDFGGDLAAVGGDLLGEAPNASQQEAARLKAEKDDKARRARDAAPEADGFMLTGSDRAADVGAAAGQSDIFGQDDKPDPRQPAPADWRERAAKKAAADPVAAARKELNDIGRRLDRGKGSNPGTKVSKAEEARLRARMDELKRIIVEADAAEDRAATADTVVNGQPRTTDNPRECLLLMACGAEKNIPHGGAAAGDAYTGPLWQTFRKHAPAGVMAQPDLAILSAKYGFVGRGQNIDPYDEKMTAEKAAKMAATPQVDRLASPSKTVYRDVQLVGGAEYRQVMRAYVAAAINQGLIAPDASIRETTGVNDNGKGIGVHREQLAQYLDGFAAEGASKPAGGEQQELLAPGMPEAAHPEPGHEPLPMPQEAFGKALENVEPFLRGVGATTVVTEKRATETITPEEAAARLQEWKAEARRQGQTGANASKMVLSLFDASGVWSQPWVDAGYDVRTFDIQTGEDINDFSSEYLLDQLDLHDVHVILAAPPCTDFSSSGAHAWKKKDADGRTKASIRLVQQTLATIELMKPTAWALENPVGRIAKLNGLPPPSLTFQPHNFGDPYTKRTLLWGNMETELPLANVEPTQGSKIANLPGADKYGRSLTPEGFAYAFFMANNAQALGVRGVLAREFANVADDVRAAYDAGKAAGMQDHEIEGELRDAVGDAYYGGAFEDAAEGARELAAEWGKKAKPAAAPASSLAERWDAMTPAQRSDLLKATQAKPETIERTSAKSWGELSDSWHRSLTRVLGDKPAAAPKAQTAAAAPAAAPAPTAPPKPKHKAPALRAAGQKLVEQGQAEEGRDRLANTHKRAAQAASASAAARAQVAMGKTMQNLADAIEAGQADKLVGVTSKAQVEALDRAILSAMNERDRAENKSYAQTEKEKGRAPDAKDVQYAKLPHPSWNVGGATPQRLEEAIKGKKGVKEVQKLLRIPPSAELLSALKKMGVSQKDIDYALGWWNQEAIARLGRFARMGITTDAELRTALNQYIEHRDGPKAEDPVKALERRLIGQKVGIDFFPTPASVAQQMVQLAGVKPGMRVLEPSAGNGNIADAAKAAGARVEAVEISDSLRELLEAKGHRLVGRDFMELEAPHQYDAILMNPPFSNRMDAEHIQRAWTMLKPGGTLVAIAGEGVFFGSDKKAQTFREWLDENGAEVDKLPAGTFKDTQLLATTGTNARLILLAKPGGDEDSPRLARGIWKSELASAIEGSTMKAAPAQGWQEYLRGLPKKGIKPDEIGWSGITDWLALQDPRAKVSKDDVLAFLADHGVQVGEVRLGGQVPDEPDLHITDRQQIEQGEYHDPVFDEDTGEVIEPGQDYTYLTELTVEDRESGDQFIVTIDEEAGNVTVQGPGGQFIDVAAPMNQQDEQDALDAIRQHLIDQQKAEAGGNDVHGPTEFHDWKAIKEGGENYRELLLTLPRTPGKTLVGREAVFAKWKPQIEEARKAMDATMGGSMQERTDAIAAYDKLVDQRNEEAARTAGEVPDFTDHHWGDTANVLAHVRFDERTDADGKKVLFVHEIQSDWAQKGRSKGFDVPTGIKPVSEEELRAFTDQLAQDYADKLRADGVDGAEAERRAARAQYPQMAEALGRAQQLQDMQAGREQALSGKKKAIPPGPFVMSTDAWVALALKRIVRYAADGGFDKVAFVTGEQNAANFGLEHQVDSIATTFYRDADRKIVREVRIHPNRGSSIDLGVNEDGVVFSAPSSLAQAKDQPLSEVIGKELADKIMAHGPSAPGARPTALPEGYTISMDRHSDRDRPFTVIPPGQMHGQPFAGRHATEQEAIEAAIDRIVGLSNDKPLVLSGDGLRVGGDGMRAFYDKIVPAAANKLLAKIGGGKLTTVTLPEGLDNWEVFKGARALSGMSENQWNNTPAREVEVWRQKFLASRVMGQPGFDITPRMKELAAEGMPLFRRPEGERAPMTRGEVDAARDKLREMRRQAAGAAREDVERIVNELRADWASGPRIRVVASTQDIPTAVPADTRGMLHEGTVWIVANAHKKGQGLRQAVGITLAHEAVAHYGLRRLLGRKDWQQLMANIQLAIASGNKPLRAIQDYVRQAYRNADGSFTLSKDIEADEIAARAIEQAVDRAGNFRPGLSFLKAVWAKVAQALRKIGIKVPFTNAELQGMLVAAARGLKLGQRHAGTDSAVIRGTRFMYGGVEAERGPQGGAIDYSQQRAYRSLREALDREQAGYSPEEIRESTGWFKGPHDGKWRFEINDRDARLVGWDAMPESKLFGQAHKVKLGELLDHPQLFAAYPALRDVEVVKRAGFLDFGGLQGWFDGKNDMGITPYAKEPLSTLLHEVQHWIQAREGFATGGNENMAFAAMTPEQKARAGERVLQALDKRRAALAKERLEAVTALEYSQTEGGKLYRKAQQMWSEHTQATRGMAPDHPERRAAFDKLGEMEAEAVRLLGFKDRWAMSWEQTMALSAAGRNTPEELRERVARKDGELVANEQRRAAVQSGDEAAIEKAIGESGEGYNLYKAIAGEIEARDIQARQPLSDDERRATAPFSSEQFDPKDVIVTYGRGEQGSQEPAIRKALEAAIAAKRRFDAADRKAAAGDVKDPDGYFALAGKASEAEKAAAAAIAATPDDGFALAAKTRDGRMLALTRSAQRPGKWQLTRFDRQGEPWGDTQYDGKLQAIRELLSEADLASVQLVGGGSESRGERTVQVDGVRHPDSNSKGQVLHPTFQGQVNFWRWFAGSKVVDDKGRPLVVYHGTNADFAEFRAGKGGEGQYFTDSADLASFHGERDGGNVMPVYLSIKNPARVTEYESLGGNQKAVDALAAKGHDGVIYARDNGTRVFITFAPEQIKSATGNDGQFDAGSGNILEDRGETPPQLETHEVSMAPALATALRRWGKGRIGERELAAAIAADLETRRTRREERQAADRVRGPDWVRERLFRARRTNELNPGMVDMALWLLEQAPHLANGLGISVRQGNGELGAQGTYNTAERVVTLFVTGGNADTAVHEILHHTERMMPTEVQDGIRQEWVKQLEHAVNQVKAKLQAPAKKPAAAPAGWGSVDTGNEGDDVAEQLRALDAMLIAGRAGDADLSMAIWKGGKNIGPPLSRHLPYQLSTPSEFWAVNGARIISERAQAAGGSWVDRAVQWLRELVQRAAGLLRLRSDAPVLRGLRAVIEGQGELRRGAAMLAERRGGIHADIAGGGDIGGTGAPTDDLFAPPSWTAPENTRVDRLIYELQDGRIDLRRVQQAIRQAGQQINEPFDARLAETLFPGRVARRTESFIRREVKPLLEALVRAGVSQDELGDYLLARHAPERNATIARRNPDLPDGGAGTNSKGELMTTQAARDYIAAIAPERRAQLDELARLVDGITGGTRALLVAEGLETQATIDAWQAQWTAYAPLFKDEGEAGLPHPTGRGFNVRGGSSKAATGSTKEVRNILAHVLMQRESAITRAEKNRVGLAIYGMALSHPNPQFWTTIRPGMSGEAIGAELAAMGVDPDTAVAGMQRTPTIRGLDPITGLVTDRPNPLYKSLPGALVVRVNGADRVLMFNQDNERAMRLAQSLKNEDTLTRMDIGASAIGKATRWLAAVNTQYNPAFGLANVTRDTWGGLVNLGSTPLRGMGLKVLANVPRAMQGITRALATDERSQHEWSRLWQQFQDDGGRTGWREMWARADDRAAAIEHELKKLERIGGKLAPATVGAKVLALLDHFNLVLENAVRLAAYKEALDEGLSRPAAAKLGRELTVDFNRKGRSTRELSPLYAFFNASVQGTARIIETIKGPTGKSVVAGGLALGVLQALMLLAADYDEDDIPDFIKARSLIIPLPKKQDGKKRFISVPYPLGLHILPNTGRVLTELSLSGGKNLGKKVASGLDEIVSAFNPLGGGSIFTLHGALTTVLPTVADPVADLATNTNFAGTPIEREGFGGERDNRPGFQRAREQTQRTLTGQSYIEISRILNRWTGGTNYEAGAVSPTPEKIRYLTEVVGGGVVRELEKAIDTGHAMATGEPVKPQGIPVFGRFYGEVEADRVERSRYGANARAIDQAQAAFAAARKAGDADEAARIAARPEFAAGRAQDQVQRRLQELNRLAVRTVDDPQTMKEIDQARAEAMRVLNEALTELERAQRGPTPGERLKQGARKVIGVPEPAAP